MTSELVKYGSPFLVKKTTPQIESKTTEKRVPTMTTIRKKLLTRLLSSKAIELIIISFFLPSKMSIPSAIEKTITRPTAIKGNTLFSASPFIIPITIKTIKMVGSINNRPEIIR